ncbi:MAG: hypothetical protein AAF732_17150 [Pseudomonadota bacterium]
MTKAISQTVIYHRMTAIIVCNVFHDGAIESGGNLDQANKKTTEQLEKMLQESTDEAKDIRIYFKDKTH